MTSPIEVYNPPSIEFSLRERLERLNGYPEPHRILKRTPSTSQDHVIERWQDMTDSTHVSRENTTSWTTSFVKRRPMTCLFLSTLLLTTWFPLLLFALFMACVFTIVFFSFVVFESCLIGTGLVTLLLFLAVPLCFSLSASLSLLVLHWILTVLQEHVQDLVEYFKAVLIFYVTLHAPKTIRRAIGL